MDGLDGSLLNTSNMRWLEGVFESHVQLQLADVCPTRRLPIGALSLCMLTGALAGTHRLCQDCNDVVASLLAHCSPQMKLDAEKCAAADVLHRDSISEAPEINARSSCDEE